ncbi:c-type cytochrome [Pararhodobacter sp.]|uniref:c-type cytochrome n=1 Tax=Pararhodobacter sp. TaxID=2127056 RepID=UPI002FDD1CAD
MRWLLCGLAVLAAPLSAQDLLGHGGPVGALAVQDGAVFSGGFDTRAILWDMENGAAQQVQRFHEGNVTAVAFLPAGMVATGGQDGRIALWQGAADAPLFATPHGAAPVSALSLAPDGATLAAGFWNGRIALLSLADHGVQEVLAHQGRLTGLGHLPDGRMVSVGEDLRLNVHDSALRLVARVDLPDLPNALTISDGRVAVAFAEGALRLYAADGALLPERFLTDRPLIAVAAGSGAVAAAAIDGTVWVLESADLAQRFMVSAGQGPVWSLALDDTALLTGGGDGAIRRWSVVSGERLGSAASPAPDRYDDGSPGAGVWHACAVCHSLEPGDNSRAGPTLHGVFGRRIGTEPGYAFSAALRSLDIIWTPQTVSELFEHGPEAYTPGSRMPEQRLPDPQDRAALVDFLNRMSR